MDLGVLNAEKQKGHLSVDIIPTLNGSSPSVIDRRLFAAFSATRGQLCCGSPGTTDAFLRISRLGSCLEAGVQSEEINFTISGTMI